MSKEKIGALGRFAAGDLNIPEKGLLFFPEKYKIVDVFETKIRKTVLSQPEEIIHAALVMPKIPGGGSRTTGFQMSLTKIRENGELAVIDGGIGILSRGTGGLEVDGLYNFTLFNDQDSSNTFNRNMGYSKRIDKLEKAVGRHLGMLCSGIEFKMQKELEESAREIAPALMRFFDLYPDVMTPYYLRYMANHNLRKLRLKLRH